MKGFKVFNHDWTCKNFQYSVGNNYEMKEVPIIGERGFHYCSNLSACFNYYNFTSSIKAAEIEAYGIISSDLDNSSLFCTNKIKIVREIPFNDVLSIVNSGYDNSGFGNSGNHNSGNHNSGNHNSGDYNSGYDNSGFGNSGDYNSGDYNSGDYNSGNHNSGFGNSGNCNSGFGNSGNHNSGYDNSGFGNSGNCNSGFGNSGNHNSGDYNSGDYNSGDYNSGDYNSGNHNSGFGNSGDYNSGDWNLSDFNNGCFMTITPKFMIFNKFSNWSFADWYNSDAKYILDSLGIKISSVEDSVLKKQYAQQWWYELPIYSKNIILDLPNFDRQIFKEITGIDVGTI